VKTKQSEREKKVLSLLAAEPSLTVARISGMLGVSEVTVRSDLTSLETQGFVIRSHGGVTAAFHPEILRRQKLRREEKERIARRAAALIEDGDTVMIEAGTTTAQIVRYLIGRRGVRIVTNSTLLMPYARTNPGLHVSVVGGTFRPETEALVGPMALSSLESFYAGTAFVGTDGFTVENGLSSYFPEAAAVLKKIAERSERVILVADSSKYGKTGFVSILPLTAVGTVITDTGLSAEAVASLEEVSVEVILA